MLGHVGANEKTRSFLEHEGAHEFCHAHANLLPLIFARHPKGIVKNGLEEIFTKDKKVIKEITTQDVNPQIGQIFPCNPIKRIHGSVAYFNLIEK